MRVDNLKINFIRNHTNTELDLNPGLNIFFGLNGSGKTSILEAVSICGFSKSFLPVADNSIIQFDQNAYAVAAQCSNDLEIPYSVKIVNKKNAKKAISSSADDHLSPKDIIGKIPIVILSPDYKSITFGAPEFRRSFIDRILSQASQSYIDALYKYKRALKQRNTILNNFKTSSFIDKSLLDPWTNIILDAGATIINRRSQFINEFSPFFKSEYASISDNNEIVDLQYAPNCPETITPETSTKDIRHALAEKADALYSKECQRGTTLFGPQKDDLKIYINSGIAKDVASQGQHKTILISLKIAEFMFLKNARNETPLILFDDVFSELDTKRSAQVVKLIANNSAQTFITITDRENSGSLTQSVKSFSLFHVNNGIVKAV